MGNDIKNILESDHREIDRLMARFFEAVDDADVEAAFQALDLFWARLAVHIRAEHHHLFPAVIELAKGSAEVLEGAELTDMIADLHGDHDMFMRELAGSIKELRLARQDRSGSPAELGGVRARVEKVERRLIEHNRLEEEKIYALGEALAARPGAGDLARSIESELANLPPRLRADPKAFP